MKKVMRVFMIFSILLVLYACGAGTSVTIKFDTNGGNEIEDLVVDLNSDEFVLPTPVKSGFVFDGWYNDVDLTDPFSIAAILSSTTLTVYAKWIDESSSFTITYITNGGSSIASVSALAGDIITAPTNPTKAGFTFEGWYSDEALTTAFSFTTMPENDLTLYAKWIANIAQATIIFESNGGSAVLPITQNVGTAVTAPANPTKTGFTFNGWFTDIALTLPYTFTTMPDVNLTLYAKWTAVIVQSTITFNTNGGSVVAPITQNVGTAVTAPANPTKAGFTFDGWFTDIALTLPYTFTTMPATSLTLYAKWTAIIVQSTITFNANGGSAVAPITQNVGTAVTAPANPTRTGYTFNGWFTDIALTLPYTFTTMPGTNLTLYAKWTAVITQSTITFNTNGGSAVAPITQNVGSVVTAPANPTRTGYTFSGWYSNVSLTTAYTFTTMPGANITLYAKWTAVIVQSTITFNTNGGSAIAPITQNVGTAVSAPANPTKAGFTFAGWYSNVTLTTAYTFTTMPSTNITLYAKWEAITYQITFNVNDEMGGQYVGNYAEGQTIILPIGVTNIGYVFVGWYEDPLLIVPFTHDTMPDHDLTVYGKWEKALYQLSFDTQGGTEVLPVDIYYKDLLIMPNDPTKEGYLFAGWYKDELLTMPVDFNTETMPSENITLYASWIEDSGYMPINLLISQEPTGIHRVRGTVIYKFPNQMVNPGFYIYDGTGTIFVLSFTSYAIGQGIEFDARYDLHEYVPQLIDVANISENLDMTDFPTPFDMTYEELASLDPNEQHELFGQLITLTGVISQEGPNFMLTGLSMGIDSIIINYKSLFGINPFVDKVGQMVTFQAIVYGFDPMMYRWHVLYDPNVPVVATIKTVQEKLDELQAFATDAFGQMVFYPNQNFIFPEFEPVYGAALTVTTSGVNAMYYDPTTGMFLDTEIDRLIDVKITATLETISVDIDVQFLLKPIELLTYQEFRALNNGEYGIVEGIIILVAPFDVAIITDGTDTLFVMVSPEMVQGDLVVVGGYKQMMDGLVMMENNPDDIIIEIISHDHPNPLLALSLTVDEFASLDPFNSNYWLQYFEVTGELRFDEMSEFYTLTSSANEIYILAFEEESRILLSAYENMIVSISGFSVPFENIEQPTLALFFSGDVNDINSDYTDEEMLYLLRDMLTEYLQSQKLMPGQMIDLPSEHPVYNATVSYETFGENALLLDLLTQTISDEIDSELWIDLHVTLTFNELETVFDVSLHVLVVDMMSVTDFVLYANDFDYYMVTGIVQFVLYDQGVAFIADENYILAANIANQVSIGDEVLLFGSKILDEGIPMIGNGPDELLVDILSHNNPNPMIPDIMTLEYMASLDPVAIENQFIYVELTGTLYYNEDHQIYFITDGIHHIPVWPATPTGSEILNNYKDTPVLIRGLIMFNQDPENPTLMLIFMNNPAEIAHNMSPLDFANMYANDLLTLYIDKPARPDSYVYMTTFFDIFDIGISYETFGPNALLYNVETGYVDASITEETFVNIRATILVPDEDPIIVEFVLRVLPIEVLSVTDFINSPNPFDQYFVEGIVIYQQSLDSGNVDMLYIIADEHNILFVNLHEYVNLGSNIRLYGLYMNQEGMPSVMNDPSQLFVGVMSEGHANPLMYTQISIPDFIDLDESDSSYQFNPYEVSGILSFTPQSGFVLIDHEGYQIPIFAPSDREIDQLMPYEGAEVKIKGLCFFNYEYPEYILLFLGFEGDVRPAYTVEEYVDYLATQLPIDYGMKYFIPGQFYHLPETDPYYPITFSYTIIDDEDYDIVTQRFASDIIIETTVIIEVEITGGSNIQTATLVLTVIPPVSVTINDFINSSSDNILYLIQGVVILDSPDEDDGPQLISDGTGSVFLINKFNIDLGDEVLIAGYKGVFEGLTVINLENDAILVDILLTNVAFPISPTPMTFNEFYALDINDRSLWGQYVEINGYIGTEHYNDYPEFYLYEGFFSGQYFLVSNFFKDDENAYRELSEYEGLSVVIRGFILPNFEYDVIDPVPMFLYANYPGSIELNYQTDLERINALIDLGTYFLESQIFYSYDNLELPDFHFLLNVSLSWQIIIGDSSIYDFENGMIGYVATTEFLVFEATLTAGEETIVHEFTIQVEPIPVLSIFEYQMLWYDEYGLTSGVIVAEIEGKGYLLADDTGVIIVEGIEGLTVGDQIAIFAKHHVNNHVHSIYGYDMYYDYMILATGQTQSIPLAPMSITDIRTLDTTQDQPMIYTELIGFLIYDESLMKYFITDGIHQLFIETSNQNAIDELFAFRNMDVTIKVYSYQVQRIADIDVWVVLFVDNQGAIDTVVLNDEMRSELLFDVIEFTLMNHDHYPNTSFSFPTSHPLYGGTAEINVINPNLLWIEIDGDMIHLLAAPAPCLIEVEVMITFNAYVLTRNMFIRVFPSSGPVPFIPGEYGYIDQFPNLGLEDVFPGLIITQISNNNNMFGEGYYHAVEMSFPEPITIGADYFILQYYNPLTEVFENYMPYDEVIQTDYNNFSIEITEPMTFRLISSGIEGAEMVSNTVYSDITDIETFFNYWYYNTGYEQSMIFSPFVGHVIEIGATVVDLNWDPIVDPQISYQWFRLDPYTYEMYEISGETNNTYQTSYEDVGYYIVGRIYGDEITVGGYVQFICGNTVKYFNPTYISDLTVDGFTLNLGFSVETADIIDYMTIEIQSFELLEFTVDMLNPGVYRIHADMSTVSQFYLNLETYTWILGEANSNFEMMMPGYFYIV